MSRTAAAPVEAPANTSDVHGFEGANNLLLYKFCRAICRVLTTLAFDLKVYGLENVPPTGGVLLLTNHASYLDPVLIGVRVNRPLSFMAKSELFENPFFSALIRSLNAFPISQGDGDVGAIRETIRQLQMGRMLNIFAEGSRTETGELLPAQPGFALIVRKANVPIIPAVIDGSFDSMPRGSTFIRPYPIRVMYGPPLKTEGLKGQQIVSLLDKTWADMLGQLRAMRDDRHRYVPKVSATTKKIRKRK